MAVGGRLGNELGSSTGDLVGLAVSSLVLVGVGFVDFSVLLGLPVGFLVLGGTSSMVVGGSPLDDFPVRLALLLRFLAAFADLSASTDLAGFAALPAAFLAGFPALPTAFFDLLASPAFDRTVFEDLVAVPTTGFVL